MISNLQLDRKKFLFPLNVSDNARDILKYMDELGFNLRITSTTKVTLFGHTENIGKVTYTLTEKSNSRWRKSKTIDGTLFYAPSIVLEDADVIDILISITTFAVARTWEEKTALFEGIVFSNPDNYHAYEDQLLALAHTWDKLTQFTRWKMLMLKARTAKILSPYIQQQLELPQPEDELPVNEDSKNHLYI